MRASTRLVRSIAVSIVATLAGCTSPGGTTPPAEGRWKTGATYTLNRPVWLVLEPRTNTYYLLPPGAGGGDPGPYAAQVLEERDSTRTIGVVEAGTRVRFTHTTTVWTVDYKLIREWGTIMGGAAPGTRVVLDSLSNSVGGDYPYRSEPDPKYLSLTPVNTDQN